jgi:thioredoxin-like negative regulator of GroEL
LVGCDHCKKLEPEYIKAAEQLSAEGIKLITVDCIEEKEVCGKFDIRGYPTMKVFRDGHEISKYQGVRDTDSIVKFMRK